MPPESVRIHRSSGTRQELSTQQLLSRPLSGFWSSPSVPVEAENRVT
ncbi:unnamed protein product [Gulo gulo]|uniref:Uncharacterized protein n=1 Tax=Gulo gulo TaxID=48420 RepID=A0A9X9LZL8_GULGU|nr:unnamed protein product [Gulo gulo]